MNKAAQTQLIPVAELAPGEVARIRNEAIDRVLKMASTELNLPLNKLIVRDIRPYTDIKWCTDTSAVTSALTEDEWIATSDDSNIYGSFTYGLVVSGSTTMADERWVVIWGVKDMRMSLATPVERAISLIKINVGGNDRVIWDLMNFQCYPNAMAGICPSPVVIPQNDDFQIYVYGGVSNDGGGADVIQYIVLDGAVIEPVGKVLSP